MGVRRSIKTKKVERWRRCGPLEIPPIGERGRESGRGANVQNTKICCTSSGAGLSSFGGKQDCGSPLSDPEVTLGEWGEGQWLSVNNSDCQGPISTATEFLRCAKMGQMHQSVCVGDYV
jgi:hypothetical protein